MPVCASQPSVGAAGFANEGQFLMISAASLRDVSARLPASHAATLPGQNTAAARSSSSRDWASLERFRPNLVVDGQELVAFQEDTWQGMRVGPCGFRTISESPVLARLLARAEPTM